MRGAATFGQKIVEIELFGLQLEASGVGASEVEEVIDEAREAAGFVEDDGEGFAILGGGALVGESHIGLAADDGKGSAELMRGQ